jgi:hypothetical protein
MPCQNGDSCPLKASVLSPFCQGSNELHPGSEDNRICASGSALETSSRSSPAFENNRIDLDPPANQGIWQRKVDRREVEGRTVSLKNSCLFSVLFIISGGRTDNTEITMINHFFYIQVLLAEALMSLVWVSAPMDASWDQKWSSNWQSPSTRRYRKRHTGDTEFVVLARNRGKAAQRERVFTPRDTGVSSSVFEGVSSKTETGVGPGKVELLLPFRPPGPSDMVCQLSPEEARPASTSRFLLFCSFLL